MMAATTLLDITPKMIDRAAKELIIEDSRDRLRSVYGDFSMRRARVAAKVMLEAALDIEAPA